MQDGASERDNDATGPRNCLILLNYKIHPQILTQKCNSHKPWRGSWILKYENFGNSLKQGILQSYELEDNEDWVARDMQQKDGAFGTISSVTSLNSASSDHEACCTW